MATAVLESQIREDLQISKCKGDLREEITSKKKKESRVPTPKDWFDPHWNDEFANEIFAHHCQKAQDFMSKKYMGDQKAISENTRAIVVDWCVAVSNKYFSMDQTKHLAVSYLDRFLSRKRVPKSHLQLITVACMFMAHKIEEIFMHKVSLFSRLTQDSARSEDIVKAELFILKLFDFRLSQPTMLTFINRMISEYHYSLSTESPSSKLVEHVSHFLADQSLAFYELVGYPSNRIAMSVFELAMESTGSEIDQDQSTAFMNFCSTDREEVDQMKKRIKDCFHNHIDYPLDKLSASIKRYNNETFAFASTVFLHHIGADDVLQ
eukprot:TRINITY_DN777828_c0_g1_i1.p1 TRINITY_DN777828_c0_g1~~TRINITY_DN777828_c0_g1_i1.p1  ORF type:complete len:322 (-),score=55.00 TRINITY_DN777828_c0_g1_i1:124-1089(-)